MERNKFKDKVLLVTGGTGTFGNAVVRRFLNTDIKEIRIFYRDEKKRAIFEMVTYKSYARLNEKREEILNKIKKVGIYINY